MAEKQPIRTSQAEQKTSADTAAPTPKKPIELFFAMHGENHGYQLKRWGTAIDEKLATTSGKVVIFSENAYGTKETSDGIRSKVRDGLSPTDAVVENRIEYLFSMASEKRREQFMNSEEEQKQIREALKSETRQGFNGSELAILDELAEKYPGRIDWIHEWSTETMIAEDAKREKEQSITLAGELKRMARQLTPKGRKRNRALLRDEIFTIARITAERDDLITEIVDEAMQEPDVEAGFGSLGPMHAMAGHKLARKENSQGEPIYDVSHVFQGKLPDKPYFFSPINSIVRELNWYKGRHIRYEEMALAEKAEDRALGKTFSRRSNVAEVAREIFGRSDEHQAEEVLMTMQKVYEEAQAWMQKKLAKNAEKGKRSRRSGPGTPHRDDLRSGQEDFKDKTETPSDRSARERDVEIARERLETVGLNEWQRDLLEVFLEKYASGDTPQDISPDSTSMITALPENARLYSRVATLTQELRKANVGISIQGSLFGKVLGTPVHLEIQREWDANAERVVPRDHKRREREDKVRAVILGQTLPPTIREISRDTNLNYSQVYAIVKRWGLEEVPRPDQQGPGSPPSGFRFPSGEPQAYSRSKEPQSVETALRTARLREINQAIDNDQVIDAEMLSSKYRVQLPTVRRDIQKLLNKRAAVHTRDLEGAMRDTKGTSDPEQQMQIHIANFSMDRLNAEYDKLREFRRVHRQKGDEIQAELGRLDKERGRAYIMRDYAKANELSIQTKNKKAELANLRRVPSYLIADIVMQQISDRMSEFESLERQERQFQRAQQDNEGITIFVEGQEDGSSGGPTHWPGQGGPQFLEEAFQEERYKWRDGR